MRWIAALLCLLAAPASAETWTVKLDRSPDRFIAYDPDTLYVILPGLPTVLRKAYVRVSGIDAPEIRGGCPSEHEAAERGLAYIRSVFATADTLTLDVVGWDKWRGRIEARVFTPDGRDLAALLIEKGLGRPYDGRRRAGWCG